MDLEPHLQAGRLRIRQIDPAELSPGEFTAMIRAEVEERGARVVLIDSLAGYLSSMTQEQHLILQMHELLSYLGARGVLALLVNPHQGLFGQMMEDALNVSYVADTVMLLRFFEAAGRIRKALSVIKSRSGGHENTIREFSIDSGVGLRIGDPLVEFSGVLTGTPSYLGASEPLLEEDDAD